VQSGVGDDRSHRWVRDRRSHVGPPQHWRQHDRTYPYDIRFCTGETPAVAPAVFGSIGFGTTATEAWCPQYATEDTALELYAVTGVWPQFFRPPYGDYSTATGIGLSTDPSTALLKQVVTSLATVAPTLGFSNAPSFMPLVAWTVDVHRLSEPCAASSAVISTAAEAVQNGGILLLHDDNQLTVGAIPLIVNAEAAQGLRPGKLATTLVGVNGPYGGTQPPYFVTAVAP